MTRKKNVIDYKCCEKNGLFKTLYIVDLNGENYIAGARCCHLSSSGDPLIVFGDVFADKLYKIKAKVWTPKLTHPFTTSIEIKEKRENEIYISDMIIANSGWNNYADFSLVNFFNNLDSEITGKYQTTMSRRDIKVLFEKVHRHYIDYLRKIKVD